MSIINWRISNRIIKIHTFSGSFSYDSKYKPFDDDGAGEGLANSNVNIMLNMRSNKFIVFQVVIKETS